MEFIKYNDLYKEACLEIFKSNTPKYFEEYEYVDFKKWLDEGQMDKYWVILKDEKIVGCGGIFVSDDKKEGGFAWGMIHKDLHGQGIGREFGKFRIKELQRMTNYRIRLCTSQHTFRFYEKLGFETYKFKKDGFSKGLDRYDMVLK
jgi:N-acetylglutamate synthase-like GNAT family acetyltransferase